MAPLVATRSQSYTPQMFLHYFKEQGENLNTFFLFILLHF